MLTVSDAWRNAVSRSGFVPFFLLEIDDGSSQWYAQSGLSSTSDYDPAIIGIDPTSALYDPYTHAVQMTRLSITVADAAFRSIIANNRIKGATITVLFGAPDLSYTDFDNNQLQPYFAGVIDETLPQPGGNEITIECLDIYSAIDDVETVGAWVNDHPLEVALDLIDNRIQFASSWRTASTFDPSDAANAENSHLVVMRAKAPTGYYTDTTVNSPTSTMRMINELLEIVNGVLIPDETGKMGVKIFDASASAVTHWDDSVIVDLRQVENESNLVNRLSVAAAGHATPHWDRDSAQWVFDAQHFYTQNDEDSQSNHAGAVVDSRVVEKSIFNPWVVNGIGILWNAFGSLATSITISGGFGMAGFRESYPAGSQPADAKASSSRPLYFLIRSQENMSIYEIVKCTTQPTAVSGYSYGTMPYWDPYSKTMLSETSMDVFTATVERAQLEAGYTRNIASIADAGGGDITVTTATAHGISVGGKATHTRCADSAYNGTFTVLTVPSTTTYTVTATYTATDTGVTTFSQTFSKYAEVVDITAQVFMATPRVKRFGEGAPVVEVDVPLTEFAVQQGDLVTIENSEFLAFGHDGLTSSTKWEVVGKSVNALGQQDLITFTCVRATEGDPTTSHDAWSDSLARPSRQHTRDALEAQSSRPKYQSGLTVASSGTAFVGTVAAGAVTNSHSEARLVDDLDITFTASKDTYVYFDFAQGGITIKEVATGATRPDEDPARMPIALVETDGSDITTVTDLQPERDASIGADVLSPAVLWRNACPNGLFGDW